MGDHMFRDLALSRDAMGEYHKRLGPECAAEQKLTAMVLQQSFWPFSSRKAQDVIIPDPVCSPTFFVSKFASSPVHIDAKGARCVFSLLQ